MPNLHYEFACYFGLAADVTSTSHDVHILGEIFELVPIPGYFLAMCIPIPGKVLGQRT